MYPALKKLCAIGCSWLVGGELTKCEWLFTTGNIHNLTTSIALCNHTSIQGKVRAGFKLTCFHHYGHKITGLTFWTLNFKALWLPLLVIWLMGQFVYMSCTVNRPFWLFSPGGVVFYRVMIVDANYGKEQ